MLDIIISIFFIDLEVILSFYIIDSVLEYYKRYKLYKGLSNYEEDVYAPLSEKEPVEEVFDEGFVNELKAYEERIERVKYELDNSEIITDEQELERE
jgi:hypothetical protein